MKKVLLVFVILLLTGCSFKKTNLDKLEINNDNCQVEKEIDTHDGFLGDGNYFAKINCSNLVDNELSSNWKELPLPSALDEIMNMVMCDNKGCSNYYTRYQIPNIKEGYYYFLDRHSDSIDKYDASDINNRSSYNFSLALYDTNNKIIYYYELDT